MTLFLPRVTPPVKTGMDTLRNDPGVGLYRRGTLPAEINADQTQVLMYYKGKVFTESNDFAVIFQTSASSRLAVGKTSGDRIGLWVKDGVSTDKLSPVSEHAAGEDVEIFIVHDANDVSQAWDTGMGGGLIGYDSVSTVTLPMGAVDNVGVLGRGHGSSVPAFNDACPPFERCAIWFGTAPDLSDQATRDMIADVSRASAVGGTLAIDVHGTVEELNNGHLRQGALRVWQTGANPFVSVSETPDLTGTGLIATPKLAAGTVTSALPPAADLTGTGLVVAPKIAPGSVTPANALDGVGLTVAPKVSVGSITTAGTLIGQGLLTSPKVGAGAVIPAYSISGVSLAATPKIAAGSVSLSTSLTSVGLVASPRIGQATVNASSALNGRGLAALPQIAPGTVTPANSLQGAGLGASPAVRSGTLTATYSLTCKGLRAVPTILPALVGSGLIVPEDLAGMTITGTAEFCQIIGQNPPYSVAIIGNP